MELNNYILEGFFKDHWTRIYSHKVKNFLMKLANKSYYKNNYKRLRIIKYTRKTVWRSK